MEPKKIDSSQSQPFIGNNEAKEPSKNIQFLKRLNVDPKTPEGKEKFKKTLDRMALISDVANNKLSSTTSVKGSQSHTIEQAKMAPKEIQTNRVGLRSLYNSSLQESPILSLYFTPSPDRFIKEIDDFSEEVDLLFDEDPQFRDELKTLLAEIKDIHQQEKDGTFRAISSEGAMAATPAEKINELRAQVSDKIIDYGDKLISRYGKKFVSAEERHEETKLIASLAHGFKVKSLLNEASDTHELVADLKKVLTKATETRSEVTDPKLREEIHRNIKYIQETTNDLLKIEKQRQHSMFPFINRLRAKKLEKLEREVGELKALTETYYNQFNFNADGVQEFHDISVEAHRPKRQHLMNYVGDIYDGAQKKGDKCVENAYNHLQERLNDPKISSDDITAEQNSYTRKYNAVLRYRERVNEFREAARQHEHIGNSKPEENLSSDVKIWNEEQKLAKEAIQELFDDLKAAYCTMVKEVEGRDISPKEAAKALTQARNEVIGAKERWDTPIERKIEFPTGNLISQRAKKSNVIEHKIACANEGYPSSSFRGREASPDTHQANLHRVTIKDTDDGSIMGDYTSSATNVEFSLEGEMEVSEKRNKSTQHQTAEILLGKVDHKWEKLSAEEKDAQGSSADKPLEVQVSVTNLLSPDSLREWLYQNSKINKMAGIDSSGLERRMLQESVEGWKAFDSKDGVGRTKDTFIIKDKDGIERTLEPVEVNGEVVFKMTVKNDKGDEQEVFVKFDIACYNVGCNKMEKLMSNLAFGRGSIEQIGAYVAKPLRAMQKIIRKEIITEYPQERGNALQDDMNKVAFEKDKVRYENKKSQLEGEINSLRLKVGPEKVSIMDLVKETDEKRTALFEAEKAYHTAKSKTLDTARQKAFQEWQESRDKLAKALDNEINAVPHSAEEQHLLKLISQKQDLEDIFNEVSDLLEFKDYRDPKYMKQNMYTLPSALVVLGCELEADPHTGCRSGKDRTSLQRMEVGVRFLSKKTAGRYLNYREMEQYPLTNEIRKQMMLNSGQIDDLAALNTGSQGLNLSGGYGAYLKEFGRKGFRYAPEYQKPVVFGTKSVFSLNLK